MQKRKLATLLGAVALVGVIGVGSTLAYLTDKTDTVTNTITVGEVELTLAESAVKYEEGVGYVDNDGENIWTVTDGNTYDTIVPGDSLVKDPTVTLVEDSEDSYVFVKVEGLDSAAANGIAVTFTGVFEKADGLDTLDGIYVVKGDNYKTTAGSYTLFNELNFDAASNGKMTNEDGTASTLVIDNITVQAAAVQYSHVETVEAALAQISWK